MAKVTIYTKDGCHLCEIAKERVMNARRKIDFELEEIDITQDENTFQKCRDKIPVVEIDGREAFVYRVREKLLIERLRGRHV